MLGNLIFEKVDFVDKDNVDYYELLISNSEKNISLFGKMSISGC